MEIKPVVNLAFNLGLPPLTEDEANRRGGLGEDSPYPILIWDESYETNREPFEKLVHRLMDIIVSKTVSRQGSKINPFSNYDLYYGNIDLNSKEVKRVTEPNGGKSNADYKPYYFFSTNVNRLVGSVLTTGPEYSLEIINSDAALSKIDEDSELAAEHFMRQVGGEIEGEVGAGVGKSLTNPEMIVPEKAEQIFGRVKEKEQHAIIVNDLLTFSLENYDARRELSKMYKDGCIVGEEWGEIVVGNADPQLKHVNPKEVGWIGPEYPNKAEDCDAIGILRQRTYGDIIHRWGKELSKSGRKQELKKALDEVSSGEYRTGLNNGTTQLNNQSDVARLEQNIYNTTYYRKQGANWMVSEHTVYFKVIKPIKANLFRGDVPLTAQELEDYNDHKLEWADEVMYRPAEKGEDGENTKSIWIIQLYKAVRLGHRTLTFLAPYPKQYRDPNDPANVLYPMVGFVSEDPCLVTLGADLCRTHWNLMFTIKKLINMSGGRSMAYDTSQLPDGMTFADVAYTSKEANLTLYNGKQENGDETRASSRHLTPVDWSLTDDITKLINLATFIKMEYDNLCGVSDSMKGKLADRQGQQVTETALQQGDLIQRPSFYLHQRIEASAMSAMANVGKAIWAQNPGHRVLISQKFGRKILKISKEISLQAYGILMKDGYAAQEEYQFLLGIIDRMASTGSISLGDVLAMKDEKNVARVRALIKDGLSAAERAKAQIDQQANQIAQQANQLKAQEMQQVASMNTETVQGRIRVAEINAGAKGQINSDQLQFKQDEQDIQNSQALQEKAADAEWQGQAMEQGELTSM